jgi:hypothetical protein
VTPAQRRIVARFRRLVRDAKAAGLVVVADSDAPSVRFIPRAEHDATGDIRGLGVAIRVDNACGGADAKANGDACCYGNT